MNIIYLFLNIVRKRHDLMRIDTAAPKGEVWQEISEGVRLEDAVLPEIRGEHHIDAEVEAALAREDRPAPRLRRGEDLPSDARLRERPADAAEMHGRSRRGRCTAAGEASCRGDRRRSPGS